MSEQELAKLAGDVEKHPNRANGYRKKRRSCAMCKPNKVGGAHQFTERERQRRIAS